jgi:nitrate/TMAO reductase-like tetraheme cytochrome c subunit
MTAPRFRDRPVLALVTSHWLAQLGLGLVLTAMTTWAFLAPARLRHGDEHPYIGVASLVVPAVLLAGLVLTPLGIWRGRARARRQLTESIVDPRRALRRFLVFVAVTAVVNVAIGTQVTYRAVHHMESRQFCASCHVMEPESTAFDPGPHAGLVCVDCHVGTGVDGWLASKVQGTRQLWQVLTDDVPRPIPSALESGRMVTSRETCERCHWTEKQGAVRVKVVREYAEDEANTPETTVLTLHVGGSEMGGIHGAHFGPGVEIRFVAADAKRQDIPVVEYSNTLTGESRTYVREGAEREAYADRTPITMECVDCHNRAAHAFPAPDQALDLAFTLGRIPTSLPFLKKQGLAILRAEYGSREAAAEAIPAALADYYRAEHPKAWATREAEVRAAGAVLAEIHARNVYPELGLAWDTYPDNRGHERSPGCFRCHEGKHATETGETITENCFRCHTASAMKDTAPDILDALGLTKPIDRMREK